MNNKDQHQDSHEQIEDDFKQFLFAQLEEIMKYKWYLGEEMKRDPLECMSMDSICLEWIEKYAKEFREYWIKKKSAGLLQLPDLVREIIMRSIVVER
jgi:hypothetical protein